MSDGILQSFADIVLEIFLSNEWLANNRSEFKFSENVAYPQIPFVTF